MGALRDAASFLTRIPLAPKAAHTPDMSRAVPWFPIVGLLLGVLHGLLYLGLFRVTTPLLAAAISMAGLALVTGAFHHDGLADMADAFGGGWTPEQRLEIMKDSRLGTYGVVALVFVILIEVAALSSLADSRAFAALVVAHGMSRAVASFMMTLAPPARSDGLGVDYLSGLSHAAVTAGSVVIAVGTGLLFRLQAVPIVIGAYASGAVVVWLSISKIGGISGDVLGAVQQISKVTILVMVVVVMRW